MLTRRLMTLICRAGQRRVVGVAGSGASLS